MLLRTTTVVLVACALSLSFSAARLAAQSTTEVTGVVADPSGAAVPGAELKLTHSATGVTANGLSNSEGLFRFSNLTPGQYVLTASKSGFSETRLSGVSVEVGRVVRADIRLQVAATQQAVEVTASSQMLDFDSSARGQIITGQQMQDIPLQTRNPLTLMTLTPGVTSLGGGRTYNRQGSDATAASTYFTINGGTRTGNGGFQELLVDGISITSPRDGVFLAMPAADALQEFRVQAGGLSAEFGRTVGGVVNYVTRGGANQFHGNLFEFHRSTATNARVAIPATSGRPPNVYNQFGGTLGGPVNLPKLYQGRNRTFFFFGYDGSRWVRNNPRLNNTPTDLMKSGNLSEIAQRIYDPASAGAITGRTPFPNNVIPTSRIDPLGRQMVDRYPSPNRPGTASNYQGVFRVLTPVDNFTGRLDHAFNDRHRLMFRTTWVESSSDQTWDLGPTDGSSSVIRFPTRNQTVNYSYTITPSLLYSAAFGHTFFRRGLTDFSGNRDGASFFGLKVTPAPEAGSLLNVRPTASLELYRAVGTGASQNQLSRSLQLNQSLSWMRGRHTLRFGADLRRYYAGGFLTGGAPNGSFSFAAAQTGNGTANTGYSVASALLGVPSGASFSQPPELLLSRYSYALYAQDDIRVNSRLTLNLGLRWDGEGAISNDEPNHVGYFDTALANSVVKRPGTFRYAGVNGASSSILKGDYNNFSPRVGFVYAADRARKTAIRGSASVITAPLPTIGYYAAAVGFEPLLQFVSPGAGLSALALRSEYQLPAASGPLGDAAYLGQSFTQPLNRTLEAARIYQWNFGVQREIGRNLVVEAVYTGNRGTRLIGSQAINQIPQALAGEAIAATLRTGNPTSAVNLLNERLPNPLSGVVPGTLGAATLTRAQLAVPFPQFSGITALTNSRDSIYHGLQMTLQRRLSSNLTFLVSYTFSKLIDNVATDSGSTDANSGVVQNPYNLRDNRGPSSYDRPNYFTVTSIWALPFGRGKRFATGGVANALLGGFSLNLALVAHGGGPLGISQSASNGLGVGSARPDVVADPASASASLRGTVAANGNVWWINPAAYALVNGRFGTAPARDSRLRGPGFQQWDIGLQRDFKIREPLLLKFRCEAFNAFNSTNLTNPVQNRSAADFGQINASFDPRVFQFGLELRF